MDSERWDIKTSTVGLCDDALQEHRPGSTDQVHESILRGAETVTERLNPSSDTLGILSGVYWSTYCLQFDGDTLGVSANGRHPSAECLPDGAVPLQRSLAAALQTTQTSTQGGQRDSGGEHGLHHLSEDDRERSYTRLHERLGYFIHTSTWTSVQPHMVEFWSRQMALREDRLFWISPNHPVRS